MRILFLSNYYPPYELGGYEQLCRDVAQRLAERGHTIHVLTSDRGMERGKRTAEAGVHRLLRIQPQSGSRLSIAAQFFLTRRQAETHNRRAFRSVMQQVCPDVVFIWNLDGLPQELALDAEAWPGAATAYWLAGHTPAEPDIFWRYWTQPPGARAFLESIKRRLSRAALAQMRREGKPVGPEMRHVAVVSEYIRRKGIAEGALPAHACVIYNGVEIEQFCRPVTRQANGSLKLLQAGRVSRDKGVHTAVEAIGHLVHEHQIRDVHFSIAGSGPDRYLAFLKELVHTQGIEDSVTFRGWLPRSAMPDLMAEHQGLLLPTGNQEPFARVVLEAMASGLAVIGTLTGGTGELLQDEVTGLSFTAGDSHDLARQIGRLATDPDLRYRLASRGQAMVLEQYTLDHMVERVEGLLERAVTEQSARRE